MACLLNLKESNMKAKDIINEIKESELHIGKETFQQNENIELMALCLDLLGLRRGNDFVVTETSLTLLPKHLVARYKTRAELNWHKLRPYGVSTIEIRELFALRDKGQDATYAPKLVQDSSDLAIFTEILNNKAKFIKQTKGSTFYIRLRSYDIKVMVEYVQLAVAIGLMPPEIKTQVNGTKVSHYINFNPKKLLAVSVEFDYFRIMNRGF